jgi:hypothetical protein
MDTFRVDVTGVNHVATKAPEAVLDFESKIPRIDSDGRPLFAVELVAIGDAGAFVFSVKVPGEPKGITSGQPVRVTGLVATTWTMRDRSGVSFRADAIEAVTSSQKPLAS